MKYLRSIYWGRSNTYLLILALTGLAFALRFYHLAFQSLWLDEAWAIKLASEPLPNLIRKFTETGENGPLYFLLLRLWLAIFGKTEFSLRFFSLLPGVAIVPLIYTTGRSLLNKRAGLIAALLATFSPFLISYSQEGKMYALLAFVSLLSFYLFWKALNTSRWSFWAAYGIVAALSLYIHIFAVLIPLSLAVFFLGIGWWQYPKARLRWLAVQAFLILPYIPLGIWHWKVIRLAPPTERLYSFVPLMDMITSLFNSFSSSPKGIIAALFVLLLVLGLSPLAKRRGSGYLVRATILALSISVPILATYAVSLRFPLFVPRYLIVIVPAYYLTLACGLAWGSRRWGVGSWLVALALVGQFLFVQKDNLWDNKLIKEDWRGAAGYVNTKSQEGDVLLLNPSYLNVPYNYYATARLPILYPPPTLDKEALDQAFTPGLKSYPRVWLVLAHDWVDDPQGLVKGWLDSHEQLADGRQFAGPVRIYLYYLGQAPRYPQPAKLGETIRFLGYDLSATSLAPGQTLKLSLYWQALGQPDKDYTVFTHLLDNQGRAWGGHDGYPVSGSAPTSQWTSGRAIIDQHELTLAANAPPGNYHVEIGLYELASGRRLMTAEGDDKIRLDQKLLVTQER
ncbi:MAG: glycosyltransferase family 39 protein [Chloroflexi bacterium]|nr:glycosyltransferase family 39 protein [Chloroflexota bacterium]